MKSTYAWENGAVWCVNHGLETYYWSCRSFTFKKKKKNKKLVADDETRFADRISIHEADGGCWRLWDSFQVEDHSRNSVSYLKSLRILALESLEAFKMYYTIGASVSSLPTL